MARGNAVVTTEAALPGLLEGGEVQRLAGDLLAGVGLDDSGREALRRLPTTVERQMLWRYEAELELKLKGIGPGNTAHSGGPEWRQARKALGALFSGYRSLQNANVQEMLDSYLGWMADLPAFAICEAVKLVGTGKARWMDHKTGQMTEHTSPDYAPSAVRMHLLASSIVEKHRVEIGRVQKVLRIDRVLPSDPSQEERERVHASMLELSRSLTRGMMPKVSKEQQAELDAAKAARAAARAAANRADIEAAWRAEGYRPMCATDGSMLVPATLKAVRQWPPVGAVRLDAEDERPVDPAWEKQS